MSPKSENKKENMEKEAVKLTREDDDAPENFVRVEKGPGSLLRAKRKIEHVMKIKDRQFIDLQDGDNVLALYDFLNVKTNERVLVFLIEETRYMYMTKEFEDDFEVLFAGTYEHPDNEELPSNVLNSLSDE